MRKLDIKLNWGKICDIVCIVCAVVATAVIVCALTSSIRSNGFADGYWAGYDEGSDRYWQEFIDARNEGMEQHEMLLHALEYFNCDSDQCIYEATGDCSFYGAPTAYCKL